MPSSKRPPLMTSIVDDSFAVRAGFRKPVHTTMCRCARARTMARAESTANDSNVISSVGRAPCGSGRTPRATRTRAPPPGGRARRSCPGVGRIPAVVLALPALGRHETDLHPALHRVARRRVVLLPCQGDIRRVASGPPGSAGRGRMLRRWTPRLRPHRASPRPARSVGLGTTSRPPRRPPFHMTDIIAAEPALPNASSPRYAAVGSAARARRQSSAERCAPATRSSSRAAAPRSTAPSASPTSCASPSGRPGPGHGQWHAPEPLAVQAFELSLDPPPRAWSSGSRTRAGRRPPTRPSRRPGRPVRGPRSSRSPSDRLAPRSADVVVETDELDQSWCHTVGYVSPLVAAAAAEHT